MGDRVQGRWTEILSALGIPAAALTGKHVPCPVCGGKDRFRFDDKDGRGTWFCAQQHGTDSSNPSGSAGNGFRLLMDLNACDFSKAARLVESVIGAKAAPVDRLAELEHRHDQAETLAAVWAMWRSARPIVAGDLADQYLRKRLGAYVPSRALRFHPAVSRNGQPCAVMLAAFVDVHGNLAGLQRTFLTQHGDKAPGHAPRLTMGSLPAGGAVRLARHDKVLGIAEGVETALAAAALHGVPCWSALNAGRLEAWEPPAGVTKVLIFGDNDTNNVGQSAASALAQRLSGLVDTQVMIPPLQETDWNDVHLSMLSRLSA
ncbi:hypothetical protein VW29_16735 [Devosia limi DSM 17137]|uniref:DNA primase/helicase Gp4 N-terminal Bacteriophage T7-like domain-containing protein n=1 Tax=Devosia limi DSM 17137 TaxID=1121477 RepID=A0A0F5LEA6_9HYPH|nr:hypothetical protein VW29_16735 [Devosia limi DSM 17137]